jgi:hypothetical protein
MAHSAGCSRLIAGCATAFQIDQNEVIIIDDCFRRAFGRNGASLLNITLRGDLDALSGPEWLLSISQL